MKILMVNKFLYPRGGAESYMIGIGKCLAEMGHEVQYFGMYDEKNTVGNRLGLYTKNMDFHTGSPKRLLYPFKIVYSPEAKRKIGKVLDDMRPDAVHLNNINFQLTPSVIDAAAKRNIPVFWTLHDYQLICPNHLLYNEAMGGVCEKCIGRNKYPCIRNKCIHGSRVKSIIGVIEAAFYRKSGTYKKVKTFIAPSRFLYDKLVSDNSALFEDRTRVLHNFVNKREPAGGGGPKFNFPYIAFAGRLSREKGTRILAQTAEKLPDVRFVVMGDGPERDAFCGLDNVITTGFLTGDELDRNIAGAQALAVPSVCFENCPMSILEGRMFSVPAVTMNMGGMAELVENNVTGVLSASVSADDFAVAVKDILSDRERLANMRKNCEAQAKNDLAVQEYCAELLKLYRAAKE